MSTNKRPFPAVGSRHGRVRFKEPGVQSTQKRPISGLVSTSTKATSGIELDKTMDEREAIVTAIKHYNPEKAKGWINLESTLDSVQFVAFDPVVTSIGITSSGRFSGITNILMSVNAIGFKGKKIRSSLSVPALVDGTLSGKKAHIDNVQIRLQEGGAFASKVAYSSAAE